MSPPPEQEVTLTPAELAMLNGEAGAGTALAMRLVISLARVLGASSLVGAVLGSAGVIGLVLGFAFGFTIYAMLLPLVTEFDVALGRTAQPNEG